MPERVLDPMEVELQMAVSYQVDSGNWSQGLLEGSLCYCLPIFSAHVLNQPTNQFIIYYLFCGSFSLWSTGWPWHTVGPPASASQALGLKSWVPVSLTALLVLCVGVWVRVGRCQEVFEMVSTWAQTQVSRLHDNWLEQTSHCCLRFLFFAWGRAFPRWVRK